MKTFKITREFSQSTSRYRMYKNGIQDLGTVEANDIQEALHEIVRKYDDQNYFPQENGSIKDCDDVTVFNPGDECVEFGDYTYNAYEIEYVVRFIYPNGSSMEKETFSDLRDAIKCFDATSADEGVDEYFDAAEITVDLSKFVGGEIEPFQKEELPETHKQYEGWFQK